MTGWTLHTAAVHITTRPIIPWIGGDGIEYEALFVSMTPCEIYERKVTMEQLHAAMASLPDKQAKRVYARYFLGLETKSIAKSEGISVTAVNSSIQRGLRNMEKFLKKVL